MIFFHNSFCSCYRPIFKRENRRGRHIVAKGSGASKVKTDQKVGQLDGPFGSTDISISKGGRGVHEVDFHFFVISDREEYQLSETFFGIAKLSHIEISKIHTITLHARTLIAIPQKSTLKCVVSYSFWGRPLKLRTYVLRTRTKFLSGQNFD